MYGLGYENMFWPLGWEFTYLSGYILSATSMPGQYDRKAARAVSSNRPKMRILFLRMAETNNVSGQ